MDRKKVLAHVKFPVEGVQATSGSVERIPMPLKRVVQPFGQSKGILASFGVKAVEESDVATA